MTVKEAKEKAVESGSVEIDSGVYLMTGKEVLEATAEYRDTLCTDDVAGDYTVEDIIPDQLYIQAGECFEAADDEDIEKCLKKE